MIHCFYVYDGMKRQDRYTSEIIADKIKRGVRRWTSGERRDTAGATGYRVESSGRTNIHNEIERWDTEQKRAFDMRSNYVCNGIERRDPQIRYFSTKPWRQNVYPSGVGTWLIDNWTMMTWRNEDNRI